MIPCGAIWTIQPFVARDSEDFDPVDIHYTPPQSVTLGLRPVARKLLLISRSAEGRRLSWQRGFDVLQHRSADRIERERNAGLTECDEVDNVETSLQFGAVQVLNVHCFGPTNRRECRSPASTHSLHLASSPDTHTHGHCPSLPIPLLLLLLLMLFSTII